MTVLPGIPFVDLAEKLIVKAVGIDAALGFEADSEGFGLFCVALGLGAIQTGDGLGCYGS